jgi:hypothetical protein
MPQTRLEITADGPQPAIENLCVPSMTSTGHGPGCRVGLWNSYPLYLNRGLGMAELPLRLNCPHGIALIRLTAQEAGLSTLTAA